MTAPFDVASLLAPDTPAPALKWNGFPKYNFIGGHIATEQVPVDDLIAGMIALAESGEHDPTNIGNPDEFTLLELAKTVIEVTGSPFPSRAFRHAASAALAASSARCAASARSRISD